MGNRSSSPRRFSSFSSSSSFDHHDHGYSYPSYSSTPHHPYSSTPMHHHVPVAYNYAPPTPQPRRRLDRKFSRIADNYQTLDQSSFSQVTAALSRSGLESSNLIVGIDFTKSNEWTGAKSFNRKSLHHIGSGPNPYEQAISIIGKTLSAFDEDNLIPCFGFGDASTHDQDVFSFYPDGRFCEGFEEVLRRYRELVPQLRLSGPTSFAPVIEMAISIVEESGGQYHVLLIIADGQVTRSIDTPNGQLSPQEKKTVDAIVKASDYPLSIVVVGVGDGPWDMMQEFDDNIPARAFDNFQFVNFTEIMSKNVDLSRKEAEFSLSALMEIPSQYQATLELNILGPYSSSSFQRNVPLYPEYETTSQTASSSGYLYDRKVRIFYRYGLMILLRIDKSPHSNLILKQVCPICLSNSKDMAFGCGHQGGPDIRSTLDRWKGSIHDLRQQISTSESQSLEISCKNKIPEFLANTSRISKACFRVNLILKVKWKNKYKIIEVIPSSEFNASKSHNVKFMFLQDYTGWNRKRKSKTSSMIPQVTARKEVAVITYKLFKAASLLFLSPNTVFAAQFDAISTGNIDLVGSEEPISLTISKISNEMLSRCFEGENLHRKTLVLLEMLGHYRWDAKVVLALASLACSFGLFQLILQLQSDNALALSLAMIKRLPRASSMLNPEFKALNLLVNTMVKLTKVIISFEGMSMHYELVDDKSMDVTKSNIYMATYWILRSTLLCSSQIADLRNFRLEKVHVLSLTPNYFLYFPVNLADFLAFSVVELLLSFGETHKLSPQVFRQNCCCSMGLHSVGNKLSSLCIDLGEHVAKCQQQIETRFYDKLLQMFKAKHVDNQEVLSTLFLCSANSPFKNSSSTENCGILELKNKVVVLLISKPELIPVDELFFLVQQTSDHPQRNKFEGSYEILWVPIPSSREWNLADKMNFEFFSNRLPWFSIRRPWSLNSTVVSYIRQEWNFNHDPIMVVLNENGMVTNLNAMDMVWIWGSKAFPFSNSREKELWEQENCMLDLIINGISPSLTEWVEEGRNICIYGSANIHWIREFNASIKKIKGAGAQLEVVYVGCKNPDENVKTIIDIIDQEKISTSLTFHKVQFFWLRLERIKRLVSAYQDHTTSSDKTSKKLAELLDFDMNENWAIIGQGSSTDVLKLDAGKLEECLDLLPLWCKNVTTMGLVGAIKSGFEPPSAGGTCNHTELMLPYEEGLVDKTVICGSCKSPTEKFVLYKCEE
ncbi:UNVERIFIED_CONTAM: E3 ubiquitin-protein ligase RGLG1 [Sesamum latifolium]|uniref:E3 ubiquitin-protein ligase RGLG1 n=1 Tax=Sesamum latifolium TaxID=2727402 RepID=A0AAW2X060_9LAMI